MFGTAETRRQPSDSALLRFDKAMERGSCISVIYLLNMLMFNDYLYQIVQIYPARRVGLYIHPTKDIQLLAKLVQPT